MAGTAEYQVLASSTATGELPVEYTGCHPHGEDLYVGAAICCALLTRRSYCLTPDGGEVELVTGSRTAHEGEQHADPAQTPESTGQNCHFHAGVE